MEHRFADGDRVQVSPSHHWAQGVYGTISEPPAAVVRLSEGWHGVYRVVQTTTGVNPYYWVTFDEPQRDAEGDGPYEGGEIPADALSLA
jgi:hypothetical protein